MCSWSNQITRIIKTYSVFAFTFAEVKLGFVNSAKISSSLKLALRSEFLEIGKNENRKISDPMTCC